MALVTELPALRAAISGDTPVPSVYACSRFAAKLRLYSDVLVGCIARLHAAHPRMGTKVAVDGSDMPAYANGQRSVSENGRERVASEFSDQDASWGTAPPFRPAKGGGFYGYPLAWNMRTARDNESVHALPLVDGCRERGFGVLTCVMGKGYHLTTVDDGREDRNVRPIIRLRPERGDHEPPTCDHGTWQFGRSD